MSAGAARAEPVDLENCASEPIHIPGAVQPHGALLVCDEATLEICQCSESVIAHLGMPPAELLGRPLRGLLDTVSVEAVEAARSVPLLRAINPLRFTTTRGLHFEAVLHRPPGDRKLLAIELEPLSPAATGAFMFDPRLRAAILRLQSSSDARSISQIAAEEIRKLTGFDRVMAYQFDAHWHGEVVAESKREELEPFLGLHYPASDIPAQARRLYELNWLRMIADVGYTPSPLFAREAGPPLDMSYAGLRSVSPIHIEYLKNMGVRASMSVSLVRDGKLTGLIACHHYAGPMVVPFAIRETCEYLGQALSWHGKLLESAAVAEEQRAAQAHEGELVRSMAASGDLLEGLSIGALVSLAGAAGAAIVLSEGTKRVGNAPDTGQLREIVRFLQGVESDVFVTDKLSDHLPAAAGWPDCAGLLAIPISRALGEYLLWFRPASGQVINWGGDPRLEKVIERKEGKPPRLSPRGSFALWRETVVGRALPWRSWEIDAASSLRRVLLGGIRQRVVELRALNLRLVEADHAKDNFLATVSHELRTPLTAIAGWLALLRASKVPPAKIAHALEVISRNVVVQARLVEELLDVSRIASGKLVLQVAGVDLGDVVDEVIESCALVAESRNIHVSSTSTGSMMIRGDAFRLRQVVTNLLGNALKFTPHGGWVRISLSGGAASVDLVVEDNGQGFSSEFLPVIFDTFRQEDAGIDRRSAGLGLGLAIVRKLVELHGGKISASSAGDGQGASFHVRLPLATRADVQTQEIRKANADALKGLRVLVIEDDADAAELIVHILSECGAQVTLANEAVGALALIGDAASFHAIVSDIGLPGLDGLELMRRLRARPAGQGGRTPSLALTTYTRAADRTRSLQAGFETHVAKPINAEELIAAVASLARR
jgi:chemotaxis family two-component system sensor kinase Cph1